MGYAIMSSVRGRCGLALLVFVVVANSGSPVWAGAATGGASWTLGKAAPVTVTKISGDHFTVEYARHRNFSTQLAKTAEAFYTELATAFPQLQLGSAPLRQRVVVQYLRSTAPHFITFRGQDYYANNTIRYSEKLDTLFVRRQRDPFTAPYFEASLRAALTRLLVGKMLGHTGVSAPDAPAWIIEGLAAHLAATKTKTPALAQVHARSRKLLLFSMLGTRKMRQLKAFVRVTNQQLALYSETSRELFRAQAWGVFTFSRLGGHELPDGQPVRLADLLAKPKTAAPSSFSPIITTRDAIVLEPKWLAFVEDMASLPFRKVVDGISPLVVSSRRGTKKNVRRFLDQMAQKPDEAVGPISRMFLWRNRDTLAPAVRAYMKKEAGVERAMAIIAAAELGDRSVLSRLKKYAVKENSRRVRNAAAAAIVRLNYGFVPEAFTDGLSSNSSSRVERTAAALGGMNDPYAADALMNSLYNLRHPRRRVVGKIKATLQNVDSVNTVTIGVPVFVGPLVPGVPVPPIAPLVPVIGQYQSGAQLEVNVTAVDDNGALQDAVAAALAELLPEHKEYDKKEWLALRRERRKARP